jgi:hypothetical protein
MLNQRSIDKIGRHLEQEGWTDEEINTALNEMNLERGVVNIALPMHFKEEALLHAECHCEFVLKLKKSSPKYKKAFEKAYSTYLIEAYENSRGIEGPNSGSHRKANPAGIEVHAFDKISSNFIPEAEKAEVEQKAPAGLVYMGQDKWLQSSVAKMYQKLDDKELVKNIVTQYSASVVSLSNAFLFAFGGYQTKRRYANTRIYGQTKDGKLETPDSKAAESTLEFSKNQEKEKMLEVAYRQITRQIYIFTMSTVIAGVMALDEPIVRMMEKGVEDRIKDIWEKTASEEQKKKGMNLAFVLKRQTRDAVIKSFYNRIDKDILNYPDPSDKSIGGPRRQYLELIRKSIIKWADSATAQLPLTKTGK